MRQAQADGKALDADVVAEGRKRRENVLESCCFLYNNELFLDLSMLFHVVFFYVVLLFVFSSIFLFCSILLESVS